MSAITGIFYRDGRNVDEKQIKKMNDRLSHRGPDGSAIWCEGSVALGHQMLHTTPESLHEKLPFEEDGLVITADARIDNRKELSVKLEIEDKEEVSDSYFILKAYQKWGEKCPEELLGDFAFAIWDKDKEKLFCARDHMGVKPFYYYLSDELFVFGTEIKVLRNFSDIPFKINYLITALYFIPNTEDLTNLTFYADIMSLPASQFLNIDQNNVDIKKYWELDPNLEIRMDSDENYVNKFLEIFTESVKCRLRSKFPLGFELSGGLDSSSIVGIARHLINKNINTFSLISEDFPENDERIFIKEIDDDDSIQSYYLLVDNISPLNDFQKILWHLEQPFISPSTALFWNLYKLMEKENIRILFTGYDGDAVISRGQNYLKELAFKLDFKRLIQEINATSKVQNIKKLDLFFNKIFIPSVPTNIKMFFHNQIKSKGYFILKNDELCKILNLKEILKNIDYSKINPNSAKELHYRFINQGVHQHTFEFMDKITAAFNIEPRYPYFDKRLVEFSYAIPTEQKFKYGWDRLIQRRAMENLLPKQIQWRSNKLFLTPVFERNFLKYEKDFIKNLLCKKNPIINRFINSKETSSIYNRYKTKNEDYSIYDAHNLWNIISLILWIDYN